MKFNKTKFLKPAAQHAAGRNQAWAIDIAMLDLDRRPLVMMVIDVYTRRPLSATVTLAIAEDIAAALGRLVRRSGCPEQVWMDHSLAYNSVLGDFHPALQAWAKHHRALLTHAATLRTRSVAERLFRDLSAFLRGKRFPTLMELGHDIERWRQSYKTATPTVPNQ